jgi:hypothetical protein
MFFDMTFSPTIPPLCTLSPGQALARGVARAFDQLGLASVAEMPLRPRLRADLMALGRKGEIWIVECKSSRADFTSDRKWQGYLEWCDRYFWAVDGAFPTELLPADTGLIVADGYGAEILREAPYAPLAPARRKAVTLDFARVAAQRLQGLRDPGRTGAGLRA